MTKNWINFRFLYICPVEKCKISPNLAKFHISPHLLCGKTEIPLHVEKFHVLKSEISPHGRFLFYLHVGDLFQLQTAKWATITSLDFNTLVENILPMSCRKSFENQFKFNE